MAGATPTSTAVMLFIRGIPEDVVRDVVERVEFEVHDTNRQVILVRAPEYISVIRAHERFLQGLYAVMVDRADEQHVDREI